MPAPVSPATSRFARARTRRATNSAIAGSRPPAATQLWPCRPPGTRSSRRRLNLRIERYGPPTGGITALTRDPSGIRASTTGWATESSRPASAAIRSLSSTTSRAEPSVTAACSRRPARSTKISPGPLTRMSPTSASSTSGWSGPSPHTAASTAATSAGDASRSSSGSSRISPIVRRSTASCSAVRPNGLRTSGARRATSIRRTVPRVADESGARAGAGRGSALMGCSRAPGSPRARRAAPTAGAARDRARR